MDESLFASSSMNDVLANRIAGELVFTSDPGSTLKKWRRIFQTTQSRLANELNISPSVISDYENSRRSPGAYFIRRFVLALISIDEARGGPYLREWSRHFSSSIDAILDTKDFPSGVSGKKLVSAVQGVLVACPHLIEREVYGFTVLDSIKAIQTLSAQNAYQIFGTTTQRALVFANVSLGRSPMVAIRVHPLKPYMVIIHGPQNIDELAIRLAEVEQVPLILSKRSSVDELVIHLNKLYQSIIASKSRNITESL
jgi:putative transcriptional regulator